MGASARAINDTARAERYLVSAWQGGFLPQAAWFLGALREKQRRPGEAAMLWSAAATMAGWATPPVEFAERLAAARGKAGAIDGAELLMKLRTVTLSGAPTEDFTTEVLVLVAADGRIEGARNLTPKHQPAFDRVLPRLKAARVPFPRPDERTVKIVRRGLLVCNRVSTCAVVFDIPGTETGSDG